MDAQTVKVRELQERLVAKSVELSQLSAKHSELTNEFSHMISQLVAGATVSDDVKMVAGARERPARRAKLTCQCKESSPTSSTAAELALLTEKDELKNRCEVLTL